MIYLATSNSPAIREAIAAGEFGMLTTPADGRTPERASVWAADNGCFGKGFPGDVEFLAWLARLRPHAGRCLFATAPDVVGDAKATLARSAPFLPVIRAMGYPAALVAQDGLEALRVPWDSFDVLFIGGSTAWKLSPAVKALCVEAKRHNTRIHLGRVNSYRRLLYATWIGADSADGTYLAFGPDTNLPKLRGWLRDLSARPTLLRLSPY